MVLPEDIKRNRLLAVIAVLLGIAALRASYPVTMPVAFSIVVIAAIWPLKSGLDRLLPPRLSYAAAVLVLLVILASFAAAIYFAAGQVVRAFATNWTGFERVYEGVAAAANRWGVPLGANANYARIIAVVQQVVASAYTAVVYIGFIGILVILGLPEVTGLRRKLRNELDVQERRDVIDAAEVIADKVRRYLGVTTLTSAMTGAASALWSLATGLELALVWGVLNFLLNYVPVVGNLVGIIPPALYALVQFDDLTMPMVVLLGFAIIQIVISNFVYPALQGQSLSLSPFAIVVALAFWSWVWGIAGALIAVPMTAAIAIVCGHFRSTQWIAKMLSKE